MSECVVRMEMPKICWDCPCLDDYGDYPRCRISNEQRGYNFPIHEKRMPNCPIVCSLPEGHGRLVDADAILNDKGNYFTFGGGGDRYYHETILEYSPTIVPAERSET